MWIISTFYIYVFISCVVCIRGIFKYYNIVCRGVCKTFVKQLGVMEKSERFHKQRN